MQEDPAQNKYIYGQPNRILNLQAYMQQSLAYTRLD